MISDDFGLTRRHVAILQAIADGQPMQEIAASLQIKPESVSRAVNRASELLGARSKSHAVAAALRKGLIE